MLIPVEIWYSTSPNLKQVMSTYYDYSANEMVTNQLWEIVSTSSSIGPTMSPTDIPGLIAWFRAEDLSALGEAGKVGTGSASWFDHLSSSVSASQTNVAVQPYYTTTKLAGGKSAVHFDQSFTGLYLNKTYTLPSTGWTVMMLHKGNGNDAFLLGRDGVNIQFRRFRSGANTISAYNGGFDTVSEPLSSSTTQSMVIVWATTGANVLSMYEGKRYVGGGVFNAGSSIIDSICDTEFSLHNTCSVAEICIWSGSLDSTQVTNLYNNYWYQKYWGEPLYSSTTITQSTVTINTSSPILVFSNHGTSSTGYTGSFIKTGGQFVETASLNYTLKASYSSRTVSARAFREVGSIATFLPSDVPNLYAWYDAETGAYNTSVLATVDGTLIDTWKSKASSSILDVISSGTNRPVFRVNRKNGHSVIQFSGSQPHRMNVVIASPLPQPFTFYYAFKLNVEGVYQVMMDSQTSRIWFGPYFVDGADYVWDMWAGGTDVNTGLKDDLNWHVATLYYSGSTSKYSFDSKSLTTVSADPGSNAWDGFGFLGDHRSQGHPFSGDIAEILVYSGSISAANHNSIVDYLGTKYGITIV